jgi:S-methyl-5-thioribose-1-phosphate isomerase
MASSSALQSLIYSSSPPKLQVLDQLLLPSEKVYVDVPDIVTAWQTIHKMQIRGAPLIAIVAVLGLAVDLHKNSSELDQIETMIRSTHGGDSAQHEEACADAVYAYIQGKMDYIATSRPTAVNLFNALSELKDKVWEAKTSDGTTSARQRMVQAICEHGEFMLERDIADCREIGKHGAHEILKDRHQDELPVTVMTICNTGKLACAGYGTALGVVRALHELEKLEKVVALETRPYNQGSRLTSFEILEDDLPGTLICDSMAAAFMKANNVAAIVVGADRVAANGDTANKIGTYALAVAAKEHRIPLYVAAPFTTLDLSLSNGEHIPIEERPPVELIQSSMAPENMAVWNPA